MSIRESLIGVVSSIRFSNPDNGYTVITVQLEVSPRDKKNEDGTVTMVGIMPDLIEGETIKVEGKWGQSKYGEQFNVETCVPISPQSPEGIIQYLSETVYGVGPVTAKRIVTHFGKDTLEILDTTPERIFEVPEIKATIAYNVMNAWQEDRAQRHAMIKLQEFGLSARIAHKIFNHYQHQSVTQLETNPYQLIDDIDGISFLKADAIAQKVGVPTDSPFRIGAGIVFTVKQASHEGHVFLPFDDVLSKATENLKGISGQRIQNQLREICLRGDLYLETIQYPDGTSQEAVYLPMYYRAEKKVTEQIHQMLQMESKLINRMKDTHWESYLAELSKQNDQELSPIQQSAIRQALTSKISILTGGPGTGKTTTLRMVINALEKEGIKYSLASPTGRAAKRLAEATGREASTIHRLLGVDPVDGGFEHHEENPLKIDMLVIDEASMIDLLLFASLLKALTPGTHLMLVGDIDQLPSVGAGNVLRDMIDSEVAAITRLNDIFRQDEHSQIIRNSHRINAGEMPYLDNRNDDFFFFSINDPADAGDMIVDIVVNRLEKRFPGRFDPLEDIQVLAPMYRGPIGIEALNQRLQAELNGSYRRAEKKLGGRIFRVGDKVLQTRNNYEKDIFNGDIGYVHAIDEDANELMVRFDENVVSYTYEEVMEEVMHAFCISVHRSQGSEYPVVILPVMNQHYIMLQRNLLYTAITRAKQVVILVGVNQAVRIAVQNNQVAQRYSGLVPRLRDLHLYKRLL